MPSVAMMFGAQPRVTLPPELASEAALLRYLGVSDDELKKIWWYRHRMYTTFDIQSRKGKTRTINAPNRRLKYLQRRIADLLVPIYRVRHPVHGFVIGKSVKSNASSHLGGKYLLNIDLKNFFPTITESRVRGVIQSLGVDQRVSEIVARICCSGGSLPQGAPTSPIISNMICFRLDRELLAVAKAARCIYTRYADDLTFSSYRPLVGLFEATLPPPGNLNPDFLSADLKRAIAGNGFEIHPDKTHYADRNSRRVVTGVKINQGLNVDRRVVRNIRAALFAFERDETAAQARYLADFGGKSSIGAHLQGKVSWLGNVKGLADPVYRSLAVRFNNLFPTHKIKVQPTQSERINRSVWVIEHGSVMDNTYRQGSVFFLEGLGLITAAHCVKGVKAATIHHPSRPSNKFKVKVVHYSKHRDLAVLSHTVSSQEYYELSHQGPPAAVGTDVVALGYPNFGPGDELNVRPGAVSSTVTKSAIKMIEVNFKLVQGMSGGPIIGANDAVVGVVHKGGPKEPRDFAIAISELDKWAAAGFADDF